MRFRMHPFISRGQVLLFLVDFIIIAWLVSILPLYNALEKVFFSVINFLPYFVMYYIFDLYNLNRNYKKGKEVVRVATVVVIGYIFSFFIFSFITVFYRILHFLLFINVIFAMPAWRYLFTYICAVKPVVKKCLIIGAEEKGLEILSLIHKTPYSGLQVVGFVKTENVNNNQSVGNDVKIFEDYCRIKDIASEYGINIIIVSTKDCTYQQEFLNSLIEVSETGVEITTGPAVFSQLTNRIPLSHIDVRWVYLMTINRSNYYCSQLKRVLDISGALFGILLSMPFYIIVPPIIKLTSKGPVFYRQTRLGIHQTVFKAIKFRTMVYNAEAGKRCSTLDNDSRITKIGKILRRTKIDELPQFINVLRGEMSLVGPRPISKKEAEKNLYEKNVAFWNLRFHLKPGLSGWAQVNYPYGATIEEATRRMEYEIFYIKNNSFLLDLLVIAKTIKCIFYIQGR